MQPATEEELCEAIRAADAPVRVTGGGTRGGPGGGARLSSARLSGIVLHEPGALTLVAKAGTPLVEIEDALGRAGQRLAFEPMDHRGLLGTEGEPTLGGVVAGNVSGPRRVQAGAARDFCLGVRFVDGSGTLVRNGGRVMKNVTGYDLVRLMAGSRGRLGVLTEVAVKVMPEVAAEATLVLPGLDIRAAVAAMAAALSSPYEVTGAAHDPAAGRTVLRIEGFADSVAYRAGRLREALARWGAAEVVPDREESRAIWAGVRDVAPFHGTPGDVWRLSVRPSSAAEMLDRAGADRALVDWGGGLLWLLLPEGADLRARLGSYAGHATLVRASDETHRALGTLEPEPPEVAALTEGLLARFDPRGLFRGAAA